MAGDQRYKTITSLGWLNKRKFKATGGKFFLKKTVQDLDPADIDLKGELERRKMAVFSGGGGELQCCVQAK